MPQPQAVIVRRDLADMASDGTDIEIAVKYAARKLAWGAMYDNAAILAEGLAELREAHAALGRLVGEIAGEIAS